MLKEPELPSTINPDAKKLDSIIMKFLEKKQEMRYQSVSELQSDLAKFLKIDYTQYLERVLKFKPFLQLDNLYRNFKFSS